MAPVVTAVSAMVVQYHATLDEKTNSVMVAGVGSSFLVIFFGELDLIFVFEFN